MNIFLQKIGMKKISKGLEFGKREDFGARGTQENIFSEIHLRRLNQVMSDTYLL